MRKAVGIFCRNSLRYLQGTCFPYLCKGKIKAALKLESSRKNAMTTTRQRQRSAAAESEERISGLESTACTGDERGRDGAIWDRAPRADKPRATRRNLHGCRVRNSNPERKEWNGSYLRLSGDVRSGDKRVVAVCSNNNDAGMPLRHGTPFHRKGRPPPHGEDLPRINVMYYVKKSKIQNAFCTV